MDGRNWNFERLNGLMCVCERDCLTLFLRHRMSGNVQKHRCKFLEELVWLTILSFSSTCMSTALHDKIIPPLMGGVKLAL